MHRREHAVFFWQELPVPSTRRDVPGTQHGARELEEPSQFWAVMRRLGGEGWEPVRTGQGATGTLSWFKRQLA